MRNTLLSLLAIANFQELAQAHPEGVDFQVSYANRHSRFAVIAIHGGWIEPESDQIATDIAGSQFSYYIFKAEMPAHNEVLHLTSDHFNDPRAIEVVSSSKLGISIHGFKDEEKNIVCVGGGNAAFRDWVAKSIQDSKLSIQIEVPCKRFGVSNATNIINRAQDGGVQLELSTYLRAGLKNDETFRKQFTQIIRQAALSFSP